MTPPLFLARFVASSAAEKTEFNRRLAAVNALDSRVDVSRVEWDGDGVDFGEVMTPCFRSGCFHGSMVYVFALLSEASHRSCVEAMLMVR